jgi:hypothetical protein
MALPLVPQGQLVQGVGNDTEGMDRAASSAGIGSRTAGATWARNGMASAA